MDIEMTGYEDREGPWKLAVAGPPGVGKTLFSSTAPNPLFSFFQEQPRIKSIAGRAVPHVKLVNDYGGGGSALDKLQALLLHLKFEDHGFDTFVVDTGDELFQSMKAARTFQNGGEFNVGDWGWIADAYREVMLAIIDLPMNVIVTFHTKLSQDEDTHYKELMLQGQAKDEAPGWFDIVGALDVFEVVDEHGNEITKRVLLTSSSRSYPWVKDHSGVLPRRFELSPGITDDFPRLLELVSKPNETSVSHEIIGQVAPIQIPDIITPEGIPSPEDLDAKKQEVNASATEPQETAKVAIDSPDQPNPDAVEPVVEQVEPALQDPSPINPVVPETVVSEVTPDEGVAAVAEIMDAKEIFVCAECGDSVDDSDLRDLTQIRFRKYLCRVHWKEALG